MDPALDPRTLLAAFGLRPNKRLGQHFLVDRAQLARIVAAADLRPTDVVLEIGPGLGVLTDALARAAGHVVAVEVDPAMRRVLTSTVGHYANVELVAADILRTDPAELVGAGGLAGGTGGLAGGTGGPASGAIDPVGAAAAPDGAAAAPVGAAGGGLDLSAPAAARRLGYKVVANLPYQITSACLRHILESRVRPELAIVMVQREVADRILAAPGAMSVLAVSIQFYARPSLVSAVPAAAFHPRPAVDSSVLRLDVYDRPPVAVDDVAAFFRTVRAGFGQKRKQLRNSLSAGLGIAPAEAVAALGAAGVDPRRRAETLDLAEWAALAHQAARFAAAS